MTIRILFPEMKSVRLGLLFFVFVAIARSLLAAPPSENSPANSGREIRTINDVQLYPSAEAREKVKSYTHGNYALQLFNTFYFFLLMIVFAFTGKSAKLRTYCERVAGG